MLGIIIATVMITIIGIVVGTGLVYTAKKFYVEADPREIKVRECLPGNNCGACGYAGCDAVAAAIVKGDAPVNACPVGGASVTEKIGEIMGTSADAQERKTAFVRCAGTCEVTHDQGNYIGIRDCRSAVLSGMNVTECSYGCLGYGSCVSVCPQNAISVKDGAAVVDPSRCIGCGLCCKACPRGLIELVPESRKVRVQCSNRDKGAQVRAVCSAGCIGCMLCTRQCEFDAITVTDNLAKVNYANCTQCGKCADKCPVKAITPPASKRDNMNGERK